jgi:hypothetical protein
MSRSLSLAGAVIIASLIGAAIVLRPRPTAHEMLPAPAGIPAIARQVLHTKMARHEGQMRRLLTRVILLDDDGVARAAGEIFDEPSLARPVAGDELNGMLPQRFFVLQDALKAQAQKLVIASQTHDHAAMADGLAALTRVCVGCHDAYLNDSRLPSPSAEGER